MSRMPSPSERLSFADVSWLKLVRHDTECAECRGLRRVTAIRDAFAVATMEPLSEHCEERKRLLSVHRANVEAERGAALARER